MMGSAILRDVASIAAASVMIQMDPKAKRKFLDGVNAGAFASTGSRVSLLEGRLPFSVGR